MNKILEIKFGSHLYGTNTENSDLDFKGIYLPSAKEICLNNYKRTICTTRPKQEFERNNKDDVDIEIFSLDRYLELLIQGQTVALDMLFHPNFVYDTKTITRIIYNNRFELLNKNINAFSNYAKQQAAKYGLKGFRISALREAIACLDQMPDFWKLEDQLLPLERLITLHEASLPAGQEPLIKWTLCKAPNATLEQHLEVNNRKFPVHATVKYVKGILQKIFDQYGHRALLAEKNEGIDWKALSHAVRVNSEAKELLEMGFITFPRPDRELLLQIKLGKLPYKQVAEIIENGLEELKQASLKSSLIEEPNKAWADDLIFQVYSDIIRSS